MKFKKYIPILIATPFVLASCASASEIIDISSQITSKTSQPTVYFALTPPKGFVTAPSNGALTTINYTATLSTTSSKPADACQVGVYSFDGPLVTPTNTVIIVNGTGTIRGTTHSNSQGTFLYVFGCDAAGVTPTVTTSFKVGTKSYSGTHTSATLTDG